VVESDAKNVKITLDDASISSSNASPFDMAGAEVAITLSGESSLTATGNNDAGLRAPEGSTLTISAQDDNTDTLIATGGPGGGTGIGGGAGSGGNITINGGIVDATGGDSCGGNNGCRGSGAGIGGGGATSNAGNIAINGGVVVALADQNGGSISGYGDSSGTIDITCGTIIATGDIGHSTKASGDILTNITGGMIFATARISGHSSDPRIWHLNWC
jgi:hypothetical protein